MTPNPSRSSRQPVLFIGHGNPMNAISKNRWSLELSRLGVSLTRPDNILAISAHWFIPGTFVTANENPPTIHDFWGFPDQLSRFEYPAPGNLKLARRVVELFGYDESALSSDWGLDHGTWSVLTHLFPRGEIPVVQLSVDNMLAPDEIIGLGQLLKPLRDENVLILASGNITHNLPDAMVRGGSSDPTTPVWAESFDSDVARAITERDEAFLLAALTTEEGGYNHPSPEHYLPLLYAYGATDPEDKVDCPVTGFDMGSLSMRSVRWS